MIDNSIVQLWQRPGFLLRRCLQKTSGSFELSCAEIGLTARQYDYLFVLDKVGQLGQGELGSTLGLDRSTNTLVLKILERKGWTQRVVVPSDTRKRLVQITPEGRQVFLAAQKAAEDSIKTITDALTPAEYQELLRLMRKVVQASLDHEIPSSLDLSPT
ncbi:MarR family winged helix-turn-helix transcriptional regulator [Hydrogenophaga sp.]|uniref:MarR family winged helix-turn-helix transcriptional regulator n=1 Tax=Hydrogenophaga sp. TaxID=1904254 RepID=UPI003918E86A